MTQDAGKTVTGARKDSHIQICLDEQVEYYSPTQGGFSDLRFDHDALPELSKNDVNLTTVLFGKTLAAPLIVGAMTGGTPRAGELNKRLARAAERCQVGFALGSQRVLLEKSELAHTYAVREYAPSLPLLFGNVGAVQLNYGMTAADVKNLVRLVGADAFNFHLNPLQESVQPEGDVDFSGLIAKLKSVIPQVGVPCLLKEVGSGISETTAIKAAALPISGIETAGVGGTSWSKIEALRAHGKGRSTGELFARWGVTTAESIVNCAKHMPGKVIIASGGIRNGIEITKALALGASAAAFALPLLKAAEKSEDAAAEALQTIIEEIRTAHFLVGARTPADLQGKALRRAVDLSAVGYGQ